MKYSNGVIVLNNIFIVQDLNATFPGDGNIGLGTYFTVTPPPPFFPNAELSFVIEKEGTVTRG